MEYLGMGRSLERRRAEFLHETEGAKRVLILGEGDGRFLKSFLSVNAVAQVVCVDSSREMLAAAKRRVGSQLEEGDGSSCRVEYHHVDARSWEPSSQERYDLIVTHFFLDCFEEEELRAMIPRFSAAASQAGSWIISEFHQPSGGWTAWRARVWICGLYTLFGWTTGLRVRRLPEFHLFLEQAGFLLVRRVTADAGLLVSELWTRNQPDAAPQTTLSEEPNASRGKAKE